MSPDRALSRPCGPDAPRAPDAATSPSRRAWLGQTLAAGAAACLVLAWPWRRALARKIGLKLAQLDSLREVGGSQVLNLKGLDGPLLLVRDGETSVRALNPMCTHKKCMVRYSAESGKLHCKCHKSAFKLDGKVLGGPAKKDLATYPASLTHDQVVVTLPDS